MHALEQKANVACLSHRSCCSPHRHRSIGGRCSLCTRCPRMSGIRDRSPWSAPETFVSTGVSAGGRPRTMTANNISSTRLRARTSDRFCWTHHNAPSATMVADATLLRTPICAALLLLMPIARLFTGCGPVRRPERTGRAGKLAHLSSRCVCGCAHCCCPRRALANIISQCGEAVGSWVLSSLLLLQLRSACGLWLVLFERCTRPRIALLLCLWSQDSRAVNADCVCNHMTPSDKKQSTGEAFGLWLSPHARYNGACGCHTSCVQIVRGQSQPMRGPVVHQRTLKHHDNCWAAQ